MTRSGPFALLLAGTVAACTDRPSGPPPVAPPPPSASAPVAVERERPPVAPVREVRDEYFGRTVVDPYRWMEADSPEMATWMKAQADFSRRTLDVLPGRAAFRARVKELDDAAPTVGLGEVHAGHVFYKKAEIGSNVAKLCVREGLRGAERVLVDPEKLADPGKHATIDYWRPTRDARYVAFGLSQSGSEVAVLRVVDVKTGQLLPDVIDRARAARPSWLDGRSFFYRRSQKLAPDAPENERHRKQRVHLHVLGADPEKDPAVVGFGVSSAVTVPEDMLPRVNAALGSHLFAVVSSGVASEIAIYTAKRSDYRGDKTPWRKLAGMEDDVVDYYAHGDDLYLLTHKNAPRFKLIRTSLAKPDLARAEDVIPESDVVLDAFEASADGLYARTVDAGVGKLVRLAYTKGAKPEPIGLPPGSSLGGISADDESPGVLVGTSSWLQAPTISIFDPATNKLEDTGLAPRSPVDFADIVAEEVKAKSSDGTLVPLSIVHKRGLARDGSHPTWLRGYGAYGDIWDPGFEPMRLAWLERGGILAVCHPRGGGENGEGWHRAGRLAAKRNTVLDFLGCAHHLVDQRFTSPAHLAGEGASAGGILIGGAITAEPELFGAALIKVGMTNALRFEQLPIGPFNVSEFGSVKTKEGFEMLWAIDAVHHVVDGTKYPAVMLATGIKDSRVSPWQSAKMAARLQAASTSGKPVLLRVDFEAGHGVGSSRSQVQEQLADEMAFLAAALGMSRP